MERGRLSLQHIIHNPLNVQRNNRPASFDGFQEEAVVGVILPEFVAGKPKHCGLVEAIGKPVTRCSRARCAPGVRHRIPPV